MVDEEMAKGEYTVGDRLLDKIDELKDSSREVANNIQKLIYYVVVIGALNGTITVGKIVEQVTEVPSRDTSKEIVRNDRDHSRSSDPRQKRPSESQSIN